MKKKRRLKSNLRVCGLIAAFSLCVDATITVADEPSRKWDESPLPIVETGLQFMSGVNPFGASSIEFKVRWLSNERLIVNAAQDIPTANVLRAERTMLVDAKTGESRQLIEPGWVLACFNPERRVGAIRPSPFKPTYPFRYRGQDDRRYRWVRIDPDGTVTAIPEVTELNTGCLPREGYPKKAAFKPLREEHGYVLNRLPGMAESPEDRAVYVRPGLPPLTLANVYPGETHTGEFLYLEFAKKYQLTFYDPHGVSSTDKRLAGNSWHNRPYELTPFRLLSLDGTVEERPYPKFIYEYGLKGVGLFLFTPVGLLITPGTSMFLINDVKITRVWGQSSSLFHTPEGVFGMRLSPNGCRLAFARTATWKPETNKPIAILELCKED